MNRETKKISIPIITTTALMAAIIFVVTYLIRIPLPFASGGYLNIGDAPIYLGAYILGGPAGAFAAALGSALSDLVGGYVFYALPTAIIKGTMGLVAGILLARNKSLLRFVVASVIGGGIMVTGYAIFEALFFNLNQAIATIPFNSVQWVGGVLVASALYPAIKPIEHALFAGERRKKPSSST
ncbi:MAG: ECF transporter S component [Clostridiales Family XIII bacterium]|nr:ECF transporter S component [Clostridiales Family XIII bacterium]